MWTWVLTNHLKLISSSAWCHVIWAKFTKKMMREWQNSSTSKHTNSLTHLAMVILTSIILLLGVFDVCRKFGKYIDSSSVWFPVLSSQLGIPEEAKAVGRVTSCYQHHSHGYKYNLQERKNLLCEDLQLTLIISKQQLGKTLVMVSVICLSRQACGELHRDGVKTKVIALVLCVTTIQNQPWIRRKHTFPEGCRGVWQPDRSIMNGSRVWSPALKMYSRMEQQRVLGFTRWRNINVSVPALLFIDIWWKGIYWFKR